MYNIASDSLFDSHISIVQVADNPLCKHAERVRTNPDFYIDFLLPNVRAYCQKMQWEQITVPVLGEAGVCVPGADYSRPVFHASRESSTSNIPASTIATSVSNTGESELSVTKLEEDCLEDSNITANTGEVTNSPTEIRQQLNCIINT